MSWSLVFSPMISTIALWVLAGVLALILVASLLRRQRGLLFRTAAGLILLPALASPQLQREQREVLPGIVALVTDDSASQSIGNRRADTEQALQKLQAQLKTIPGIETRVIHAGEATSPLIEGTQLFQPLIQNLSDVPAERIAGVILLSDGNVHDVPLELSDLPFRAPVHALITGTKTERDRRMTLVDAPRFAIVGNKQTIGFKVEDENGKGDAAHVIVKHNGVQIADLNVRVGELVTQEIDIKTAGENVIELSVDPIEGELTALNNRAALTIKGVRENLRVLLISGEPHSGERTWRNLLKSDAAVDLVHFTILRPPDKVDGTPIRELSLIAFPVRELFQDKIDQFDLIIFDRYERRSILPLAYFDNMVSYVRKGGAILIVSGPEDAGVDSVYQTSLASVLPTEPNGTLLEKAFWPTLSDDGKRHPVTRDLPGSAFSPPHWSRWFRTIGVEPRSGNTLLNGPDKAPLLVLDRVDEGRVAALLSDQVWLWARGFEGGGPHTDLLRRIVHWLMKEPDLDEEALRARQSGANIIIERQTMGVSSPETQVERPDGSIEKLTLQNAAPGLWRGTNAATMAGLYRISQGEKTALIAVGPPNPKEFAEVRSTTALLKPISDASGGTAQRLTENFFNVPRVRMVNAGDKAFGPGWIGLATRDVSTLKGVENYPLLQALLGLALILGLTSLAWWREGR